MICKMSSNSRIVNLQSVKCRELSRVSQTNITPLKLMYQAAFLTGRMIFWTAISRNWSHPPSRDTPVSVLFRRYGLPRLLFHRQQQVKLQHTSQRKREASQDKPTWLGEVYANGAKESCVSGLNLQAAISQELTKPNLNTTVGNTHQGEKGRD